MANKKYRGHCVLPDSILEELDSNVIAYFFFHVHVTAYPSTLHFHRLTFMRTYFRLTTVVADLGCIVARPSGR